MNDTVIRQQESASITAYRKDCDYKTEAHVLKEYTLNAVQRDILRLLCKYPYLTRAVLEVCLEEKLEKILSDMFISGVVERIRVTRQGGRPVSVFYSLGKNVYTTYKKELDKPSFSRSYLHGLEMPARMEIATLSQWCALTVKRYGTKSVAVLSYGMPNRKVPYVEATLRKNVNVGEAKTCGKKRYLDYLFHILPRPKTEEIDELYLENILCIAENSLSEREGRSFVLVLCESEKDMEELASILYFRAKGRVAFEAFYQKILFSIESNAFDEMGGLKYCNTYRFEEHVIKGMQVAFR